MNRWSIGRILALVAGAVLVTGAVLFLGDNDGRPTKVALVAGVALIAFAVASLVRSKSGQGAATGSDVDLFGLALGLGVAATGVWAYEAWWTIAFAIGAVAIAFAARRQGGPAALAIGTVIVISVALGMLGMFAVYGAMAPGGAPCGAETCTNPSLRWVLLAVTSLTAATLGLRLAFRFTRQRAG